MLDRFASPVSALVFAVIVQMLLSPATSAQTKKNCDLENLSKISAALDICSEIALLRADSAKGAGYSIAPNDKARKKAMKTAGRKLKTALRQVDQLDKEEQKYWLDRKRATTLVKISIAIIGGVGAGVGGYLRLKSSKELERDGTKVSLFAGLAGATLGSVAIWLDSCKKFTSSVSYVNSYAILDDSSTNSDTYCKDPSRLSNGIHDMKIGLSTLQSQFSLQ